MLNAIKNLALGSQCWRIEADLWNLITPVQQRMASSSLDDQTREDLAIVVQVLEEVGKQCRDRKAEIDEEYEKKRRREELELQIESSRNKWERCVKEYINLGGSMVGKLKLPDYESFGL